MALPHVLSNLRQPTEQRQDHRQGASELLAGEDVAVLQPEQPRQQWRYADVRKSAAVQHNAKKGEGQDGAQAANAEEAVGVVKIGCSDHGVLEEEEEAAQVQQVTTW